MSARGTALAMPKASPVRDALVVVSEHPDIPAWVVDWCRRAGRAVQLQPAAGTPEACIGIVAGLAGRSVLVQRDATGGVADGAADEAAVPQAGGRLRPRVVAAVQDLPVDAAVLTDAAEAAEQLDAALVLAHGVPLSFGERSVGLSDALERGGQLLAEAADLITSRYPGRTVTTRLVRMRPHELVGEELDADLLVVGGSHQRIPPRLGLVASSALQHAPCPVLLSPRPA